MKSVAILVSGLALSALAAKPTAVETALKPYVDKGEIPGYISILIDGDREDWTLGGWADVEKRMPMKRDTLFRICSQTKGICGAAAAKLVAEGKMSLDDPVSKYLPEFRNLTRIASETNGVRTVVPVKAVMTLRDVLSHTGGLTFETSVSHALGWTSTPPRIDAAIAAAEPLLFEPGTKWKYSNTGINVAVAVIEKVTGERIEDHLRRVIFDPLGMKDTTFKPNAEQQSRLATIYSVTTGTVCRARDYGPLPKPYDSADRFPSGGAGLFSTAQDLIEFYRMLAFGGVARNGRRVLPEKAVTEILAVRQTPKTVGVSYSLGLFVDGETIWHDGALKTTGYANPRRRQARLWMMSCDYAVANRWHQFNVWRPVADGFFKSVNSAADEKAFNRQGGR